MSGLDSHDDVFVFAMLAARQPLLLLILRTRTRSTWAKASSSAALTRNDTSHCVLFTLFSKAMGLPTGSTVARTMALMSKRSKLSAGTSIHWHDTACERTTLFGTDELKHFVFPLPDSPLLMPAKRVSDNCLQMFLLENSSMSRWPM